jgi:regulator of sigma E protease
MAIFNFLWDYILPFLFILTVLVYVHEMGHYLIARRNGVRVEVFSIGFGPEIFGWTNAADTRWKICAVPFGGYVKMFGESDVPSEEDKEGREMTAEERAVSFHHKRLGQRSAIVAAGPIANFLLAIAILAGIYSILGTPRALPAVGAVVAGSAADEARLQRGDLITGINGKEIQWFEELRDAVRGRPNKPTELIIMREGARVTVTATPKSAEAKDESGQPVTIGLLGVSPDPKQVTYQRLNPLEATWRAIEQTIGLCGRILDYLGQIISGSRGTEDLGGPIRIAQISGEMAQGGFVQLLSFMAALSINLGLINLFPIPMLDGGHLIYYILEGIRGRPVGPRAQEYGFRFGLLLVLMLMVFATWNDLVHLKVIEYFMGLVT